ncbi:MAG: hypothetical protein VXZ92_08020, partial [SAR324 cluster bacterium]|nr:hypothetical protein [SAR324 cluster bacterium]
KLGLPSTCSRNATELRRVRFADAPEDRRLKEEFLRILGSIAENIMKGEVIGGEIDLAFFWHANLRSTGRC